MKHTLGDIIFYFVVVCIIITGCYGAWADECTRSNKQKLLNTVYKATVAEAIGESEGGITAVVLVFRNRLQKGMKLGSCALKRKDLNKFISKQPKKKLKLVKQIVQDVFDGKVYDVTYSADHFENVKRWGKPWWSKKMKVTTKIGSHWFFRSK